MPTLLERWPLDRLPPTAALLLQKEGQLFQPKLPHRGRNQNRPRAKSLRKIWWEIIAADLFLFWKGSVFYFPRYPARLQRSSEDSCGCCGCGSVLHANRSGFCSKSVPHNPNRKSPPNNSPKISKIGIISRFLLDFGCAVQSKKGKKIGAFFLGFRSVPILFAIFA